MGKKKRKRWEHDPVYLVIPALGIGLGFTIGAAGEAIFLGLGIGAGLAVLGCIAYYFIKRALAPKQVKPRSKYRL